MRIAVLVNRVTDLRATMTTTMIVARALERGDEVVVCDVDGLAYRPDDTLTLRGKLLWGPCSSTDACVAALGTAAPKLLGLDDVDVVMLRTNPARDRQRVWAHQAALRFAALASDRGTLVLNSPAGLGVAGDKLFVARLPRSVRPASLVTRSPEEVLEFVEELQAPCVLKPLNGTHGRDVFRVHPADLGNLRQIVEVLTREDYAVVQEYLPEAPSGDTRFLLVDGSPLVAGNKLAVVTRVPRGHDFRCNVSAGGQPEPARVTPEMLAAVELVGPVLRQHGLFLVGLDFIGSKIIEVNAFSPGGFRDAERFLQADFTGSLLDAVAERVARHHARTGRTGRQSGLVTASTSS